MVDRDNPPPAPIDSARANTLRELYEHGPLYRKYAYSEVPNAITVVIDTIHLYCPVCQHDQPFGSVRSRSHYFQCRACQRYAVQFYLQAGQSSDGSKWLMKVGQYPPATERLPKELETRLPASDLDFYRKALRSRTFGFGLASLAYLRRVVENRTNDLLDMIAEAASRQGETSDLLRRLAEAKASYQFEQKVELAAQLLPASLKPGGMNPLDALHDLASAAIHRLTEEECLDLFDPTKTAFEYLFRQLQVDRDAAREYVEAMHKLQQAREESIKKAATSSADTSATNKSDDPRGDGAV